MGVVSALGGFQPRWPPRPGEWWKGQKVHCKTDLRDWGYHLY